MSNFLPGHTGRLPVRGADVGVIDDANTEWGGNDPVSAAAGRDGTVWVTRSGSPAKIRPQDIPYREAADNSRLDVGRTYDMTTGTEFPDRQTDTIVHGTSAQAQDTLYGLAYNSHDGQTTLDHGLGGPRQWVRPIMWTDGSTLERLPIDEAPHTALDIAVHLNRLFLLGGFPPNAAADEAWSASSLFFMEEDLDRNGRVPGGISTWQKEGVTNRVEIPGADPGKSLFVLGTSLVILKERSVWALYGSSPDSFVLRKVSDEVGCLDGDSVVLADGGAYFTSHRGVEFFDGTAITTVSALISPLWDEFPHASLFDRRVVAHTAGREYLVVRLGKRNAGNTFGYTSFTVHRPTRTWAAVTGEAMTRPCAPVTASRLIVAREKAYSLEQFDAVSSDRTPLSDFSAAARVPNAFVFYRISELARPGYAVQLHRAFLSTKSSGPPPYDDPAWTWIGLTPDQASFGESPSSLLGDALFGVYIPGDGRTNSDGPSRGNYERWRGRNTVIDVFEEADAMLFYVSYSPSEPAHRAEIYDGAIEYQVTRQRRTTRPRSLPK